MNLQTLKVWLAKKAARLAGVAAPTDNQGSSPAPSVSLVGQPLFLNVPRGDIRSIARCLGRILHLRQSAQQPRNVDRKKDLLAEAKKYELQLRYVPDFKIPDDLQELEALINKVYNANTNGAVEKV